jgi:two-component system CheB/CheR fusion protein
MRSTQPKERAPFRIVGIGASAGGLKAVTTLLRQLSANSGMAFVVIQHLDPTHSSALPSLLQRTTAMPVTEAKDGMPVEANCVYAIPPNRTIRLAKRRIKVSPRAAEREVHMPINHFLESLAEEGTSRSVAVILSGNGSDGTRGACAIKEAGGVTFAQDEKSAKYGAMPASAVASGCVDFVMPPEDIAKKLLKLAGRPSSMAASARTPAPDRPRTEEQAFGQIVELLRQRSGVDFTHYKRATLDRRIQRRMGLRSIFTVRGYAEYLRLHPAETHALFSDILIHVTGFFRDADVFAVVKKKVFPRLLKGRNPIAPLRIWVPGCSSGEEVYSMAIALMEFLADRKQTFPVQFFGTDVNLATIEQARAGFYPDGVVADVSPDRLQRFFTRSDGGYLINKSIRELCVFARQNVVADPPFPNLDLISYRNLLIYLGQELQRKVFPVFHYALQPNGFLLLGASETTGTRADLFALVDKPCRIYAKKAARNRPALPIGFFPPARKSEAPPIGAVGAQNSPAVPETQEQVDRAPVAHFDAAGAAGPEAGKASSVGPDENTELARLREELSALRGSLRATIEEQDATNEELRSANEEIMSSNEELQSTNEELENTKEEMQSANEELTTLNDELENRNAEMGSVNNDLHNLMASVNIPVVMVGPDLCIRRFTTCAEKILNLTAADMGSPITDAKLKVKVPGLDKHIADVIDSLQTRQIEVKDHQGHWWSVRIRPYKTTDLKIDGAVVAFVDIDLFKMCMERTIGDREYAEAVINTVHEPVVVLDHNLIVEMANGPFYKMFKVRAKDTLNRSIYELGNGQWGIPKLRSLLEDILPHNASFEDFVVERTFPTIGRRRMSLNARRLARGGKNPPMILLAIEDVTAKVKK